MRTPSQNVDGVGERLKEAREGLSKTQREMADSMGIGLRTYVSSEAGERALSIGEVAKLAKLGVNIMWLLTGMHELPTSLRRSTDAELMGRVVDALARLYKEENQHLPAIDQGRFAAEIYDNLVKIQPEADRPGALRYAIELRRAALREALRDPASSKRQA